MRDFNGNDVYDVGVDVLYTRTLTRSDNEPEMLLSIGDADYDGQSVRRSDGTRASIKGLVLALAMILVCFPALSSPVTWRAFRITDIFEYGGYGHQSICAEFSDMNSYPCISMRVDKKRISLSVSAAVSMPGLLAADWVIAVFATAGDVLTWDYFKDASVALDNHAQDGLGAFAELTAPVISGSKSVKYNSPIYLAVLFWTNDTPGYTWCKLVAFESGFAMPENATAFQEGLIVGTGNFAPTPEPSSAMLLLLGCAGLLLKRCRVAVGPVRTQELLPKHGDGPLIC